MKLIALSGYLACDCTIVSHVENFTGLIISAVLKATLHILNILYNYNKQLLIGLL